MYPHKTCIGYICMYISVYLYLHVCAYIFYVCIMFTKVMKHGEIKMYYKINLLYYNFMNYNI